MTITESYILKNDADGLIKLLKKAAKEFNLHTLTKDVPQVGIVGEIFLKFNPFSHEFIEKYIISKGIEIVPPLLAPFFLQEFVNVEAQKQLKLSCSKIPNFIIRGLYQATIGSRMRKINKAASAFRYFRPFTNIYDDAKEVQGIVSLAAQFGEGWLLPSDIIGYLRDGINNVISLQPFGCIANHVVSKGIEKKLHKLYPQLNMVSLDFDSGVSSVNITNRLLLFLDSIAA
jgi:predicted nucleotide-binding protein (sugar kinase/HSP70/actin superfamily)